MKERLRSWVERMLRWTLEYIKVPELPVPTVEVVPDPLSVAANKVIVIVKALNSTRVAPARHLSLVKNLQATKMLAEMFPEARTREIKFAIEVAIGKTTGQ